MKTRSKAHESSEQESQETEMEVEDSEDEEETEDELDDSFVDAEGRAFTANGLLVQPPGQTSSTWAARKRSWRRRKAMQEQMDHFGE
jgi:hypothetical protein